MIELVTRRRACKQMETISEGEYNAPEEVSVPTLKEFAFRPVAEAPAWDVNRLCKVLGNVKILNEKRQDEIRTVVRTRDED